MKGTLLFLAAILTTSLIFSQNTLQPTGNVSIGTAPTSALLNVGGNVVLSLSANRKIEASGWLTGGASAIGFLNQSIIQSDVVNVYYNRTLANTQATSFTLASLIHYGATQNSLGAGSSITTQTGFWAESSMISGATNYGFRGSLPIGTGTANWNAYMGGTAPNYFNGDVLIGTTANSLSTKLFVDGTGAFKNPTGGPGGTALSLLQVSNGSTASPASNKISWIRTDLLECGSIDVPDSRTNVNGVPMVFSTRDNSSAVSEKMRIDNGGNVGIGTTTPLTKLHIDVASSTGSSSVNGIRVATGLMGLNLGTESANNYSWIQSTLGGVGQKNLSLNPYGGNVGIGTSTPTSKLTVNGTIHSTEVKVTSNLTPDYVFEKYYLGQSSLKPDYTLLTLPEVEKFTKENHHLPNVPSAKEIKENGLHLGEMSNILLQKIEELTLYSIEQQKIIEKQAASIEKLERENQAFKSIAERLSKIEKELEQ